MGNPLSGPLPIHVAITPESEDFQQDLVTSPLSSIVSIDVKSENLSKRRERPQVLLVEDNPINLKVGSHDVLIDILIMADFSSCS